MNSLVFSLVLLISLVLGAAAISQALALQRRYRLAYLSSYLYFQIFITVFGLYGLSGRLIARKILIERGTSYQTVESIGHFFFFLGLPFFILAWYMFLRLCREMAGKSLSRRVTAGYFLVLAAVFFAYGTALLLANISAFSDRQYAILSSGQVYATAVIEAFMLVSGLSYILTGAAAEDHKVRNALRVFGLIWLVGHGASLALFLNSGLSDVFAAAYIFVFSLANLLPLLFWRTHLGESFPAPSLLQTSPAALERFIDRYKITKREEEVIRELCSGKSNKEISESLFISLQTVKDHIYRIYQKTDVRNRVQLINLIQGHKDEPAL
ncbi:MAG: two-component system regulator [Candidatus Aminicenantes bacterium]|nr:two-component system regulator [Candidatus Aminicenantes bacterium]